MGSRFFSYCCGLLVFLSCGFSVIAQAQVEKINNLRLWHSPDRTRLVFDLSAEVDHKSFMLDDPLRFVIDFGQTELKATLPELDKGNAHVLALRAGTPSPDSLRFVFELKKPLLYKSFLLTPNELYGHRLVVDLMQEQHDLLNVDGSDDEFHEGIESDTSSSKNNAEVVKTQPKPQVSLEQQTPRKLVVAIDAGHGGADPGAIGYRGSHEKKLTLDIAKKLKGIVEQNPNMTAELIRKGDYFIGLHKRRIAARQLNADIFVSIHADAFTKQSARGFSVFALSQRGATSAMAKALAAKENAADLIGGVSLADKDQVLAQVLVDLSMTNTISESVNLGGRVLKELGKLGKLHSSRVEQAGFAVLKSPDMPSILVETGFITNPTEEKNLLSSSYQNKVANAIYTAINGYYLQTPYFSNSRYASPNVSVKPSSSSTSEKSTKVLIHKVGRGDSLSKISAKYNVTISALKKLNNLQRDTVYLGQKIKLPGSVNVIKKPSFHKVKRGDTLSEIAEKYNVSMKKIIELNKLRSRKILLGQKLKLPN